MNAQLRGSRGYGVTQEKPLWHDVNKEKKDLQRPLPESDRGTGTAGDCNTGPRDVAVLYIELSKPNAENPSFSPALLGW